MGWVTLQLFHIIANNFANHWFIDDLAHSSIIFLAKLAGKTERMHQKKANCTSRWVQQANNKTILTNHPKYWLLQAWIKPKICFLSLLTNIGVLHWSHIINLRDGCVLESDSSNWLCWSQEEEVQVDQWNILFYFWTQSSGSTCHHQHTWISVLLCDVNVVKYSRQKYNHLRTNTNHKILHQLLKY